jgi:hypothetical protein
MMADPILDFGTGAGGDVFDLTDGAEQLPGLGGTVRSIRGRPAPADRK